MNAWVISAFGNPRDILYSADSGQTITRDEMESLGGEIHILNGVIDGWADVLNYEEKFRSRDSPRRFFLKTGIMDMGVEMYDMFTFKRRFSNFKANLHRAAGFDSEGFDMKNIDLLFIPMSLKAHHYCGVFNFKASAIEILDNLYDDRELDVIYDYDVYILQQMMVHYLNSIANPDGKVFHKMVQTRFWLDWQTRSNSVDSGVFLMRHMETYMGGGSRGWSTGFPRDGYTQSRQIASLRKKYVSKIITCEANKRLPFVESEYVTFNELDDKIKEIVLKKTNDTRARRLIG